MTRLPIPSSWPVAIASLLVMAACSASPAPASTPSAPEAPTSAPAGTAAPGADECSGCEPRGPGGCSKHVAPSPAPVESGKPIQPTEERDFTCPPSCCPPKP